MLTVVDCGAGPGNAGAAVLAGGAAADRAPLVSLLINLVQVLTSLQDMTISTVPRLLATAVGAILLMPWMLRQLACSRRRCSPTSGRFCAERKAHGTMPNSNRSMVAIGAGLRGRAGGRNAGVRAVPRQQRDRPCRIKAGLALLLTACSIRFAGRCGSIDDAAGTGCTWCSQEALIGCCWAWRATWSSKPRRWPDRSWASRWAIRWSTLLDPKPRSTRRCWRCSHQTMAAADLPAARRSSLAAAGAGRAASPIFRPERRWPPAS